MLVFSFLFFFLMSEKLQKFNFPMFYPKLQNKIKKHFCFRFSFLLLFTHLTSYTVNSQLQRTYIRNGAADCGHSFHFDLVRSLDSLPACYSLLFSFFRFPSFLFYICVYLRYNAYASVNSNTKAYRVYVYFSVSGCIRIYSFTLDWIYI